ncbi:hypothetical protein HNQ95_006748 [Aminobacter ciceronei]|jgi:hypothetical protein|uniref:Uncharacterized protein n=1 Tax=Aminobacter ciceronei TaxID=150723 RepID=A0ABR6CK17_9HYPH|nr:hypothetical protein [Aminobacter ciceronei]MBA9024702.1 hypothetical protein [Aminobacter ciceronei]
MGNTPGFFGIDDRLQRLSDLGDQLEAYRRMWTSRRSDLFWKRRLPVRAGGTVADRRTIL